MLNALTRRGSTDIEITTASTLRLLLDFLRFQLSNNRPLFAMVYLSLCSSFARLVILHSLSSLFVRDPSGRAPAGSIVARCGSAGFVICPMGVVLNIFERTRNGEPRCHCGQEFRFFRCYSRRATLLQCERPPTGWVMLHT